MPEEAPVIRATGLREASVAAMIVNLGKVLRWITAPHRWPGSFPAECGTLTCTSGHSRMKGSGMGLLDRRMSRLGLGSALLIGCVGVTSFAGSARAAEKVDYATQIKPLLKESCVKCHSLDNPRKMPSAGLRLDDKALALKGGKHGAKAI